MGLFSWLRQKWSSLDPNLMRSEDSCPLAPSTPPEKPHPETIPVAERDPPEVIQLPIEATVCQPEDAALQPDRPRSSSTPLIHFEFIDPNLVNLIQHWEVLMPVSAANLEGILQNFVSGTSEVQGAALVSPDGLPLATSLPLGMDDERVSAMSAAMLSLGERIGSELARGAIERIAVEGDKGTAVLTSCGQDAVLLVLASPSAKQGLLLLEIKRVLSELKGALIH